MSDPPETVLITGASSGIGKAFADVFAADRARLILVARNAAALQNVGLELQQKYQCDFRVIVGDLADPETCDSVFQQVTEIGWQVDVLVNNAGFGAHGEFSEIALERQLSMIQVNVSALVALTHQFLPGMISRGRGEILNVGSTAAFQPGPHAAVYFATKAFVLSFSEALWAEVRHRGVQVTCVCPGPTRTNFGKDYRMTESAGFRWAGLEPTEVARLAVRALRRQRRIVITGGWNRCVVLLSRILPRRVLLWAADRFIRGPH
ncbi:MAG: SDR family oxidoreductase [Planctomycetes bacterium]|nr:SDR family oxidoreductase [Planctomycetota bacterium]